MAGHSKWANIKYRKAIADAKKGKAFTKVAREIETAARRGGSDPNTNFTLRLALDKARAANMPRDNIDRAVKRGTGELQSDQLDEIYYEGYGPEGSAIMILCLTDNRNRTVGELRNTLRKHNGSLGESGSVAWQFDLKGLIVARGEGTDPDELMLTAIDAGAEEVDAGEEGYLEVITAREDLQTVQEALSNAGLTVESAELSMIPKTTLDISPAQQAAVLKLVDLLDELDDVQQVYHNVNISQEVLETA